MKFLHQIIVLLFIFQVILSVPVIGQVFERVSYIVKQDNHELAFPFAGGLEAPQFSLADLDLDGTKELFVFERAGNVSIPFKYTGEGVDYQVDWDMQDVFPSDLQLWTLLRDFNGDDIIDIFASTSHPGIQGVDIYRGYDAGGFVEFERMHFDIGDFDLLYIPIGDIFTPLYAAWADVPAVDDIDNDGDLDIITFEPGGKFAHYFRNYSVERSLGIDTFDFELEEYCWGRFLENEFNEEIILSDDPDKCASPSPPGITPRHSGSTISTFDADGDSDKDVLIGDLGTSEIKFLENGGSPGADWMTNQLSGFPGNNVPINIPVFVSSFVLDINQDGLDDLVASSNNPNFSENVNVGWYYENTGTTTNAVFELRKTNFLVDEMLDFGSASSPAFADYNADGLLDIVVGTTGFYNEGERDPRLILLENTGTADVPAFEVVDLDWLNFSQFSSIPTWNFVPSFGDLDNDGDEDLVVGEQNGQLFFVENIAGPELPMDFAVPVYPFMDISVGVASAPKVFDLNGDGYQDLVVGERTGNNDNEGKCSNLNYFQNLGSPGNAVFEPDPNIEPNTACLGRVIFNEIPALREYSNPEIILTNDGLRLISGSDLGQVFLYGDLESNIYGSFTRLSENFGEIHEGFRTAPAIADLDGDGFFEVVTGNMRGGLSLHRTDLRVMETAVSRLQNDPVGSFTPNPFHDHLDIRFEMQRAWIEVWHASGKRILHQTNMDFPARLNTEKWPSGYYIISIITEDGRTAAYPAVKGI